MVSRLFVYKCVYLPNLVLCIEYSIQVYKFGVSKLNNLVSELDGQRSILASQLGGDIESQSGDYHSSVIVIVQLCVYKHLYT